MFNVWGTGYRFQGARSRVNTAWYIILASGYREQDTEFRRQGTEFTARVSKQYRIWVSGRRIEIFAVLLYI